LEGTFHVFFIGHQNLGKNFSRQERTDFVGGKPLKDGDAKATRLKTFWDTSKVSQAAPPNSGGDRWLRPEVDHGYEM